MRIGEYEVKEVTHDSVKVGCTTVSRAEVESLLNQMIAKPLQEFPNVSHLDFTDSMGAINLCKEQFSKIFMHVRTDREYKNKGFVLGSGWKVVTDSKDVQVLIRARDM